VRDSAAIGARWHWTRCVDIATRDAEEVHDDEKRSTAPSDDGDDRFLIALVATEPRHRHVAPTRVRLSAFTLEHIDQRTRHDSYFTVQPLRAPYASSSSRWFVGGDAVRREPKRTHGGAVVLVEGGRSGGIWGNNAAAAVSKVSQKSSSTETTQLQQQLSQRSGSIFLAESTNDFAMLPPERGWQASVTLRTDAFARFVCNPTAFETSAVALWFTSERQLQVHVPRRRSEALKSSANRTAADKRTGVDDFDFVDFGGLGLFIRPNGEVHVVLSEEAEVERKSGRSKKRHRVVSTGYCSLLGAAVRKLRAQREAQL
jgi:hypothetical protein